MRIRTIVTAGAAGIASVALAGQALARPTASPPARAANPAVVRLGEYFFRQKTITIPVGSSVRFVNVGKIEHTVADSTRSGSVRSKVIHPRALSHGKSQTVRFAKRGTIYYVCTFHPSLMRGVIIVR